MITIDLFIMKLKEYISSQLTQVAKSNPIVGFMKPFITRALDKNITKIHGFLGLISDDNGNIDIENILSEMLDNISKADTFTLKAPIVGNIQIGNSQIKFNIPFTDKSLVFNSSDLEAFKEILTTKNE